VGSFEAEFLGQAGAHALSLSDRRGECKPGGSAD
jgi:hypothetical protein